LHLQQLHQAATCIMSGRLRAQTLSGCDQSLISQREKLMAEQPNLADCVTQHLPFLNRIVCSLTRGDQMAEDIVQDTILKALMHADQFRFESTLKTWLGSIAVNEVRQVYRSSWRTRAVPLITENLNVDRCPPVEHAKERYEAKERDVLVREAVSRLPQGYRSVIELCDLQCVPLKQAARELGLTIAAVKSRQYRARQKLRPLVAKLRGC
jgi:RNA polymerase sigma-70 factor, ECF subfamily